MYNRPYKEIGIKIRTAREKKNLTQKQLAKLVGISRSAICKLELGQKYRIDWQEMCLLEQVLEIEIKKPTLVKVG